MKKILLLIGCLPLLFMGCFEDTGNYSYVDINEITEISGIDSVCRINQFDTLRLNPGFVGSQYSDASRFDYEWEIDRKVVSTDLNLVFPVRIGYGEKFCRLIIIDKELQSRYYHSFKLIVSSTRAGDVIMVLSNYKNNAELSYKPVNPDTIAFVTNYYQDMMDMSLGANPKRIYQNYISLEAFSGLLVQTDEGLKSLADTTLVDFERNTYLDESFFYRQIVYPKPDVPDFHPEGIWMGITDWFYQNSLFINSEVAASIIAGGRLFSFANNNSSVSSVASGFRNAKLARESPYGGKLSPVMFPVWMEPTEDFFVFKYLCYDFSDYFVLFDETVGRFLYSSGGGSTLSEIPEDKVGVYEGYRMIYGAPTNLKNYAVALLAKGDQVKALLLRFPTKSAEVSSKPFSVAAELDMPVNVMNANSRFYNLKKKEYMLVSTENQLLYGNVNDWRNGTLPHSVFALADIGYGADAKITGMFVSRTEKSIVLGVSRYGADISGSGDELKGDVVVLDMDTYQIKKDSKGKDMHWKGIAGYPVDVIIKYQNWYRDGKNEKGQVMDNI